MLTLALMPCAHSSELQGVCWRVPAVMVLPFEAVCSAISFLANIYSFLTQRNRICGCVDTYVNVCP